MSRPICWVDNDDEISCYWRRSWHELYHFICDNASTELKTLMWEWLEGEKE